MKKICVTYHMERAGEIAETCIDLPLSEELADAIVRESHCAETAIGMAVIAQMVTALAYLQGYPLGTIQDIRYAKVPKEA